MCLKIFEKNQIYDKISSDEILFVSNDFFQNFDDMIVIYIEI